MTPKRPVLVREMSVAQALERRYKILVYRQREWFQDPIDFTFAEFKAFARSSGFRRLWNAYARSGFQRYLAPTIDRIDNSCGYSRGNIQLLTMQQNSIKSDRHPLSGEKRRCPRPYEIWAMRNPKEAERRRLATNRWYRKMGVRIPVGNRKKLARLTD